MLITEHVEAPGKHGERLLPGRGRAVAIVGTVLTLLTSLGADSSGGGKGESTVRDPEQVLEYSARHSLSANQKALCNASPYEI